MTGLVDQSNDPQPLDRPAGRWRQFGVLWGEFTWRHPEWWALLIAFGALTLSVLSDREPGMLTGPGSHSPAHVHGGSNSGPSAIDPAVGLFAVLGAAAAMAAMMLPLAVATIRRVAFSNFRDRTDRSVAMFLIGYLAVWTATAAAITAGVSATDSAIGSPAIGALALTAAALWQRTDLKRRVLRRCDPPVALSSRGTQADREHARLGLATGTRCVLNCWALMAVVAVVGHHPLMVTLVVAWLVRERYGRWAFHHIRAEIAAELRWAFADARALHTVPVAR